MTNSAKKNELSPAQIQALDLMMAGASVEEVARATGKSARTIHRWKKRSAFCQVKTEVTQKVRDTLTGDYAEGMTRLGMKAIGVVESILDNDDESARSRLQAAALAGKWASLEVSEFKLKSQFLRWLEESKSQISEKSYSEVKMTISSKEGRLAEDRETPTLEEILDNAAEMMLSST